MTTSYGRGFRVTTSLRVERPGRGTVRLRLQDLRVRGGNGPVTRYRRNPLVDLRRPEASLSLDVKGGLSEGYSTGHCRP